jgi:hypothetical protein
MADPHQLADRLDRLNEVSEIIERHASAPSLHSG